MMNDYIGFLSSSQLTDIHFPQQIYNPKIRPTAICGISEATRLAQLISVFFTHGLYYLTIFVHANLPNAVKKSQAM